MVITVCQMSARHAALWVEFVECSGWRGSIERLEASSAGPRPSPLCCMRRLPRGTSLNLPNFAVFLLMSCFQCLRVDPSHGRCFGKGWLYVASSVIKCNSIWVCTHGKRCLRIWYRFVFQLSETMRFAVWDNLQVETYLFISRRIMVSTPRSAQENQII